MATDAISSGGPETSISKCPAGHPPGTARHRRCDRASLREQIRWVEDLTDRYSEIRIAARQKARVRAHEREERIVRAHERLAVFPGTEHRGIGQQRRGPVESSRDRRSRETPDRRGRRIHQLEVVPFSLCKGARPGAAPRERSIAGVRRPVDALPDQNAAIRQQRDFRRGERLLDRADRLPPRARVRESMTSTVPV